MSTTLEHASKEWSKRPADERYGTLEALHEATTHRRQISREAVSVPYESLRVQAEEGGITLLGKANVPSKLTHWSFGQLATKVGAPSGYLRGLPATLAAQNLNHGLAKPEAAGDVNLLLSQNGGYTVRAFTSDSYTRIWDADVTQRLLALQAEGTWQPAPAAFDGSRGLYASDHDLFAFMVDNNRRIFEKGPGGGLGRGFFVWNSEVGARTFGVMTFFYEYVCGNHRVWGATGVQELKIRHVGNADARAFRELAIELRRYADSSAQEDEGRILRAKAKLLGDTKDEVLDRVFGMKIPGLTRGLLEDSYKRATMHEAWYGNPKSVWGLTGGITEVARDMPYADQRAEVDKGAWKLTQVAF